MTRFTFLFIFLSSFISAQEVLIPHEKDGKWGYISMKTKAVVVPYQYTLAEAFMNHGVAKVKIGDKWGLLDAYGDELVPVKYDYIYTYKNNKSGITRFNLDGKWGLFDAAFNTILPAKYQMIHDFYRYYWASANSGGSRSEKRELVYFKAKKEGKWGVIDRDDQVILSFQYDDISYIHKSNVSTKVVSDSNKNRIYLPGSPPGRCGTYSFPPVSEDYFFVTDKNQGKIITTNEKVVYTLENYEHDSKKWQRPATLFASRDDPKENGIFVIRNRQKFGGISTKGKLVIPFEYEAISYHYDNIFHIKKEGKTGIVTTKGDLLQSAEFDKIYGQQVILNGKHGILNSDYKSLMFPIEFDTIISDRRYRQELHRGGGLIHVKQKNQEGLLDYFGKVVLPLGAHTIQFCRYGVIIQTSDRWGIINYQQDTLLAMQYDKITLDNSSRLFVVEKNNQSGVWSTQKKDWIAPLEYDRVKIASKDEILVQKDEKWGIIHGRSGLVVDVKYDEIKQYKGRIGDRWEPLAHYKRKQYEADRKYKRMQQGIQQRAGKFGVIGKNDNWLVAPQYQKITQKDKCYQLIQDDKMGITDLQGSFIIQPAYEEIFYDSRYNFIKAKQNGKWGVIDKKNNLLVPFQYTRISGLKKNIIRAFDGTYYNLFDEKGNRISEDSFTDLSNMSRYSNARLPLIYATKAYRTGIIDEKGKVILPIEFQSVRPKISAITITEIPALFPVANNDKWGYAQKDGTVVIPFQFDEVSYFYKNMAIVKKENKCFLIDQTGELLIKKGYSEFVSFNEFTNLWIVMDERRKLGAINLTGEEVIPLVYDELKVAAGVGRGFYHIKLKGKYGIVDQKGKIRVSAVFDSWVNNFHLGMLSDAYSSLRGLDGKILLKRQYDNARRYYKNYYIVQEDGKSGIVDILTEKLILPLEYDEILFNLYRACSMDYFVVQKGTKVGLVDFSNKIVLPIEYETIHFYPHLNVLILSQNGKAALADMKGNLLTKFEYEEISPKRYPPFPVKKNEKWGYINTSGKIIYPLELERGNRFYTYYDNEIFTVKNSLCLTAGPPDSIRIQASIKLAKKEFWLSVEGKITEKQPSVTNKTKITDDIFVTCDPTGRSRYLINAKGEKILPHTFSRIDSYHNGFIPFAIRKGKKGFYLPSSKKEVLYDGVQINHHDNATIRWVSNDRKIGFINKEGKEITPLHFESVGQTREGMISVMKDGKMGFLNASGEMEIPMKFDDYGRYLPFFDQGVAYASLNGKYGFINLSGKTIAPFEFEAIAYFENGVAIAYRNGKWEKLLF